MTRINGRFRDDLLNVAIILALFIGTTSVANWIIEGVGL